MPADMKNLVCWPKGSKECWLWKLKACDYSLKPAALCMMSYLRMTRTSVVTSRQWSPTRTASAVRLRDRDGQRKMVEGEGGDQSGMHSAMLHPPPCMESISRICSTCTPVKSQSARNIAANNGILRNTRNLFLQKVSTERKFCHSPHIVVSLNKPNFGQNLTQQHIIKQQIYTSAGSQMSNILSIFHETFRFFFFHNVF